MSDKAKGVIEPIKVGSSRQSMAVIAPMSMSVLQ
jgi:hypothetical protein